MIKNGKTYCNVCGAFIPDEDKDYDGHFDDEKNFHICAECWCEKDAGFICPVCEEVYLNKPENVVDLGFPYLYITSEYDEPESRICTKCFKDKFFPDAMKLFKKHHLI